MVKRIFDNVPRKIYGDKMSYKDFVFFILCEENKDSDQAIDYFFSLLDVDGDGYLDYFDYKFFWDEMCVMLKAHHRHYESQKFDDLIC